MPFDGDTYHRNLDAPRLVTQLEAVQVILQSGKWYTLSQLTQRVMSTTHHRATEPAISARLRDLRKTKFGGHQIERLRTNTPGLFRYRLKQAPKDRQGTLFALPGPVTPRIVDPT